MCCSAVHSLVQACPSQKACVYIQDSCAGREDTTRDSRGGPPPPPPPPLAPPHLSSVYPAAVIYRYMSSSSASKRPSSCKSVKNCGVSLVLHFNVGRTVACCSLNSPTVVAPLTSGILVRSNDRLLRLVTARSPRTDFLPGCSLMHLLYGSTQFHGSRVTHSSARPYASSRWFLARSARPTTTDADIST